MTFKDVVARDIGRTFLNGDEFATRHVLDGQEVLLIIDEDEVESRRLKAVEGTYLGELLFYMDKASGYERFVEGQRIMLDGKYYFVVSCKDDGLMYEVIVGANSAW